MVVEDWPKAGYTASVREKVENGNPLRGNFTQAISLMTFLKEPELSPLSTELILPILNELWGTCVIVETEHPHTDSIIGSVTLPGATSLVISFDPRSALGSSVLYLHSPDGVCHETFDENRPVDTVTVQGDTVAYRCNKGTDGEDTFGLSMIITGHSDDENILFSRDISTVEREAFLYTAIGWSTTLDEQLVQWMNKHVENHEGISSGMDVNPLDFALDETSDALLCSGLMNLPLRTLQMRLALLRAFNRKVQDVMSFLDVSDTSFTWTIASRMKKLTHCIYFDVKAKLVEAGLEATWTPAETGSAGAPPRITLNRIKALESNENLLIEPSVSEGFFAQAFHQLHNVETKHFCKKIDNKGRLFSVKFFGEEGVDWGGVYRDGATSIVDNLFSAHFNLFILCPNGQHDIGNNRNMFVPNPMCTSPKAIQMFEFAGKLLGISFRTKADFPFLLPSIVWKQFVQTEVSTKDLHDTDAMVLQMLDGIRNCTADNITNDGQFQRAFESLELRFVTTGSNGQIIPLVPEGGDKMVTFENRCEYCDLVLDVRLSEFKTQVHALRKGLYTVVPQRIIQWLTWSEMELLTCGSPKIDIAVWKKNARYDGYVETDATVILFWRVLESFSENQRADFVRFAWGRSRLPRGRWPQPFKLTKKGGRDSTKYLPVAHTCFFSVELPPYTTEEEMRKKLLATIGFGLAGILMA